MNANTPQFKHLRSQLDNIMSANRPWRSTEKDPSDVRRARAIVRSYDRAQSRKRDTKSKRLDALYAKAKTALLFGNEKQALAAVKKFESQATRA